MIKIFIINLLVRMFLNKWKFNDKGFVKFFNMLIGNKNVVGEM